MAKVFADIKKNPAYTKKAAAKNPKRDHRKFREAKINRK